MRDHTEWLLDLDKRLTRVEVKMNLIAFFSGATFVAVVAAIISHVI